MHIDRATTSVRLPDLPEALDGLGPDSALVLVDLTEMTDADFAAPLPLAAMSRHHGIVIGTSSTSLPDSAEPLLEALTVTLAPGGPGQTWVDAPVEPMLAAIAENPSAATVLATLLPMTAAIDATDGLVAESLAYSMLLASPEFARWHSARPQREVPGAVEPVLLERSGDVLDVVLNRPERRNAFGAQVRDGLLDALELARLDETIAEVRLRGAGAAYCSGGDLDEFGTATDTAQAHMIRLRASAGLAVHELRRRVRPLLHGACIGAGIEVPAFANRVVSRRDAWFQLPELRMGLVPGAGGTVSVTRRIGRWRTAYLGLSSETLDAETALAWGLVDDLID